MVDDNWCDVEGVVEVQKKQTAGKLVPLTNVQTSMEAEMLQDILQQEHIPVIIKEEGSGGYMKVYMGYSIYGETLYVYDYDYPRAREIMLALQQSSEADIASVQSNAFSDADAFDAYEGAQLEMQEQEDGLGKRKSVVPFLLVGLFLLLYALGQVSL